MDRLCIGRATAYCVPHCLLLAQEGKPNNFQVSKNLMVLALCEQWLEVNSIVIVQYALYAPCAIHPFFVFFFVGVILFLCSLEIVD